MKFLWKLFSRLVASLLSVVLLLSLILLPLVSFVTDISDSNTLIDLIFSSGILEQLSAPSSKHHNVLLSNGTVDTGSNPEVDKLVESLKELLNSGEMSIKELIGTLKAKLASGELDVSGLTATLQELITGGALNVEEMMKEFGIPESIYQMFLSPNGTMDITSLVETLHILMDSGLLDMETLLEEIGIPADTQIDTEQIAKNLAKSSVAKELLATYTEDVLNAATGVEAALPCEEGRYNRYLERKIKEEVSL